MMSIKKLNKKDISERIFYLYEIENPVGKKYIGLTGDFLFRKKSYELYVSRYKKQRLLYQSILHYGFSEHKFKVIKSFKGSYSVKELSDIEQDYIHKLYIIDKTKLLNLAINGISHEDRPKLFK